jgi:hypothetical protein
VTAPRPGTVLQGGRAKAYRPLPVEVRAEAVRAGLDAYERGDFFEAHELLEPAWMGTSDPAERELVQGVIKLAAAFVHRARRNPEGIRKNLLGARDRLADAGRIGLGGALPEPLAELDAGALLSAVDGLLAAGVDLSTAPPRLARRA